MKGMKGLVLATATAALLTTGFAATAATADFETATCIRFACLGHYHTQHHDGFRRSVSIYENRQ